MGCHKVRFRKLNCPHVLLTQGTRSPYGHEQSEEFSPVQNLKVSTNYIPEKLRDVFTVAADSSSVEE